jgi:nickel superoxide dismutase
MKPLLRTLLDIFPSQPIYAHCDIPCGIYDPKAAQIAASTVLKMVQKFREYPEDDLNNRVRAIWTKEEHARKCKEEILILWTDYFKPEHLEKFPDLHDTFWKAAILCSKNKQSMDEEAAKELVETVDKIAEIFTETKK